MFHAHAVRLVQGCVVVCVVACGSPAPSAPGASVLQDPGAAVDPVALHARASAFLSPLPEMFASPTRPVTEERIQLGRQLYYEKRLSKNHDLSCNSCHDLAAYGVDSRSAGGSTSIGHRQQLGGRNSPTSYNAAAHVAQFWDGRAIDVEEQAKGPILNPVEMALPSAEAAVQSIASIPGYAPLFAAAFPGEPEPITFDNIAIAIGAFERKLVTRDRFDRFLSGDMTALDRVEQRGLALFMDSGCVACHNGPALGGGSYQKIGLLKPYPTADVGRLEVTKQEADRYFFKVPSLRNIERTAPYLHDGSLPTLMAAVTTMAEYQTPVGPMSDDELFALVSFLQSLTGELPAAYVAEPPALPSGPTTPLPDPS